MIENALDAYKLALENNVESKHEVMHILLAIDDAARLGLFSLTIHTPFTYAQDTLSDLGFNIVWKGLYCGQDILEISWGMAKCIPQSG